MDQDVYEVLMQERHKFRMRHPILLLKSSPEFDIPEELNIRHAKGYICNVAGPTIVITVEYTGVYTLRRCQKYLGFAERSMASLLELVSEEHSNYLPMREEKVHPHLGGELTLEDDQVLRSDVLKFRKQKEDAGTRLVTTLDENICKARESTKRMLLATRIVNRCEYDGYYMSLINPADCSTILKMGDGYCYGDEEEDYLASMTNRGDKSKFIKDVHAALEFLPKVVLK